jgi:hypothetical protein
MKYLKDSSTFKPIKNSLLYKKQLWVSGSIEKLKEEFSLKLSKHRDYVDRYIIYDEHDAEYSSLVRDDLNTWQLVKQTEIPANSVIDMTNPVIAAKIAKQIRAVFYKIK